MGVKTSQAGLKLAKMHEATVEGTHNGPLALHLNFRNLLPQGILWRTMPFRVFVARESICRGSIGGQFVRARPGNKESDMSNSVWWLTSDYYDRTAPELP